MSEFIQVLLLAVFATKLLNWMLMGVNHWLARKNEQLRLELMELEDEAARSR